MVFLGRKPPHMPKQHFVVGHAQVAAQQRPALRVMPGKQRGVDAVGQHRERRFAKQHTPRLLATGKPVGQPGRKPHTHHPVQRADEVALIGGVVAVARAHRHAGPAGGGVVKHAKAAVVPVQNAPLGVGGKQRAQVAQVAGQVVVLPHGQLKDAPAQRFDLLIKKAGFVVMVQKVKLYLRAVDGAVQVHHKGLHAAGVHGGHDLQNADRRHHKSSASSCTRQSFSSASASSLRRG